MGISKKILIAYIVGGVGFTAGAVGLGVGLTRKASKTGDMGKVYLHMDTNPVGTTYNGTEDWYYTADYANLGEGFAKRGQPVVDYKKGLGWARVDTNLEAGPDWRAPTTDDIVPDDQWPVRPLANKICHLFPMYVDTHYKVTFETKGGTEVAARMVEAGHTIKEEDVPRPMKGGSKFKYWCSDEDLKTPMDWTKPIIFNTTVYADYDVVSYQIHYHYEKDGQEFTYTPDEWYVNIPEYPGEDIPEKEGSVFLGWNLEDGKDYPNVKEGTKMTSDLDVYAAFSSENTTYQVTVNPNGGYWSGDTSDKENKSFTAYKMYNPIKSVNDMINHVGETSLSLDNKQLAGWNVTIDSKTEEIKEYPYEFNLDNANKKEITFEAIWKDSDTVHVTFDASPGYFKYYNSEKQKVDSSYALSYECEVPTVGSKPKIKDIYEDFLKSISTAELEVVAPIRDGYELNEDDGFGWSFNGETLTGDEEISSDTTLNAVWSEKEASNWWTDDWHTIVKIANAGLAEDPVHEDLDTNTLLEDVYYDAFHGKDADGDGDDDEEKVVDSFVGLQKEVELFGFSEGTFTTRVIGYGQDQVTADEKCLLTFDFVDCPLWGAAGETNDYANSVTSFQNSTLRDLLRSTLPDGLRTGLKTVSKTVITSVDETGTKKCGMESFNADLFLLSATEIGSCSSIDTTKGTFSTNDSAAEIETQVGLNTFFTYDFYNNHRTVDSDTTGTKEENAFRKKTYKGEEISWWLRTPANKAYYLPEKGEGDGYNVNTFYVTSTEGGTKPKHGGIYDYVSTGARGISPAFCIGVLPQQQ